MSIRHTLALVAAALLLAALWPTGAAAEESEFKRGDKVTFRRAFVMSQVGANKGEPWSVDKGDIATVRRAVKNDILIVGPDGERAWTKARFIEKADAGDEGGAAAPAAEPEATARAGGEEPGTREMELSLDDADGGEGADEAPAEPEPAGEAEAREGEGSEAEPESAASADGTGSDLDPVEPAGEAGVQEGEGSEPAAEAEASDGEDSEPEPETEEIAASGSNDLDAVEPADEAEVQEGEGSEPAPAGATARFGQSSNAPLPTWTVLVAGGAAIACAALGAGFGVAALDAKASHEEYTSSSLVDHVVVKNLEQRYEDRKLVANVMFGVAGGMAAAGVVALLLSEWGLYGSSSAPAASVGPTATGDGVVARAAFRF